MTSQQFVDSLKRLFESPDIGYNEESVMDALLYEYTNWEDVEDKQQNIAQLDHVMSDVYFTCESQLVADRYAEEGMPVYFYHFTHRYISHFLHQY